VAYNEKIEDNKQMKADAKKRKRKEEKKDEDDRKEGKISLIRICALIHFTW
jgi:hypothetical protein